MQLRKDLYTSTRGSRLFCFKSLACFRYILDGSTHIRAKNIRFFKITKCILYLHHNKTFQQFLQIMPTLLSSIKYLYFLFCFIFRFLIDVLLSTFVSPKCESITQWQIQSTKTFPMVPHLKSKGKSTQKREMQRAFTKDKLRAVWNEE